LLTAALRRVQGSNAAAARLLWLDRQRIKYLCRRGGVLIWILVGIGFGFLLFKPYQICIPASDYFRPASSRFLPNVRLFHKTSPDGHVILPEKGVIDIGKNWPSIVKVARPEVVIKECVPELYAPVDVEHMRFKLVQGVRIYDLALRMRLS
jgi:hypothetical protein